MAQHLVEFRVTTKRSNFILPNYEDNDGRQVNCPGKKIKDRVLGPGGQVTYSAPRFAWGNKYSWQFDLNSKKDKPMIKFLRENPLCEGSPNGDGQTYYYRYIDPEEVSKKEINSQMFKANALGAIMEIVKWTSAENKDIEVLDQEKFDLLGYVCSQKEFTKNQKSEPLGKILQVAQQNPKKILNCLKDGKAKFEKMIVDAVKFNVLTKKGAMYWFGKDNCIGNQATLLTMISTNKDANSKRTTAAIVAAIEEAKNAN